MAWLDLATWNWLGIGKVLLQFGLLLLFCYWAYSRMVQQSPAADRLLKGVFLVFILFLGLWGLARLFSFGLLEAVFAASLQLLVIGLIVIFQPELRRVLFYLGQSELFGGAKAVIGIHGPASSIDDEQLVEELRGTIRYLSKTKTGGLIVLEPRGKPVEGAYLESGTPVKAVVSRELLLTIFHPNTPLHDGAVVIDGENRIAAAGVLLPLTEDPNLSWQYGTRHRAAIGVSEVSDCACLVVSEETGSISFVKQGKLKKLATLDELLPMLEAFYNISASSATNTGSRKLRNRLTPDLSKLFATDASGLQQKLQSLFSKKE